MVEEELYPYIKEHNGKHICFADTIQQATNALKCNLGKQNEGMETKLPGGHLMLFGIDKWKGNSDAVNLKGAFKSPNNNFERIEVFGCEWDSAAQQDFANAIGGSLDRVKTFDLDNTEITVEGAKAIFPQIANSQIEKLNLQGSIGKDGVVDVMVKCLNPDSVLFKTIVDLDLKINDLKESAGEKLGELAARFNLDDTKIDLFYNELGGQGTKAFCLGLQAPSCKIAWLDLSCNNIGDAGAIAISKMLETNRSLKTLKLALNNIGNDGGVAIFKAIVNDRKGGRLPLRVLDISANVMKEEYNEEADKLQMSTEADKLANTVLEQMQAIKDLAFMEGRDRTPAENEEYEKLRVKYEATSQPKSKDVRPLTKNLSKMITAKLDDFDFTGVEFGNGEWSTIATALKSTQGWFSDAEKQTLKLRFSIVDLMNETNLQTMERQIWTDAAKVGDDFQWIDWRRKEEKKEKK